MTYAHLTIFLQNGTTLRFHSVEHLDIGQVWLTFTYKSASDGKLNEAKFSRLTFAGFAVAT
jgi:hypothetical protein